MPYRKIDLKQAQLLINDSKNYLLLYINPLILGLLFPVKPPNIWI